jgi:hypothetical protein
MWISRPIAAMLCFALCACAIHPLPENVTGVKTAQIVHRNRCEARDALLRAEQWLNDHNKANVATLRQIGVVLSYSLDMTEMNGLSANATFEQILTNSTTTLNPMGGDMLSRQNTRAFTVADNFQTLSQMRNCAAVPGGPNYQYPIVGTIGIDETVVSFLTMALHEDLNGALSANAPPTDPSKSIAGSPTMVDTLVFTTTLSAGVSPMIMLTPIGTALQLTNATVNLSLSRQDMHQVTVGLGLPTVAPPEGGTHHFVPYSIVATGAGAASSRMRTPLLINASVPAGTGAASGISVALEAVNDEIIRREVLRRGLIALH